MANQGPNASIFWLDAELESDHPANGAAEEAAMQIAFADRVILNKVDLVTDAELDEVAAPPPSRTDHEYFGAARGAPAAG